MGGNRRKKKRKRTNFHLGSNVRTTWTDRRAVLWPRGSCFSPMQAALLLLLPIFILKVCYLKGHLLESWRWWRKRRDQVKKPRGWQRLKKQNNNKQSQRGPDAFFWTLVWAAKSWMTSKPWPEETQNSPTARDHLLTICVVTLWEIFCSVLFCLYRPPSPWTPSLTHSFFSFSFCFPTQFWRYVVTKRPVKPN